MPSAQYYLGIDGGGSTTRAMITDSDSSPIGYGEAGPCNPNTVGCIEAANQIDIAIRAAIENSQMKILPTAAHFGIAGVGNQEMVDEMRAALSKYPWFPKFKSEITHDLACALEGGLAGRPGIVLVAGTGSAAYGKNAKGETARASGRDLGNEDPGSGYAIGLALIRKLIEMDLQTSSLLEKQIEKLGLTLAVADINDRKDDRSFTAKFAPAVISAAEDGDQWCAQIIDQQAKTLSSLIKIVEQEIFAADATFDIVFQGGLLLSSKHFRERTSHALTTRLSHFNIRSAASESREGACILARKFYGSKD